LFLSKNISCIATGDSFISRNLPEGSYSGFKKVKNLIQSGDFRFTNFEMTTPEQYRTPAAVSGGTWAGAEPSVISGIKEYGFNSVAWANNHTLDYLYDGLNSTQANLDQSGLIHAGV